MLTNKYETNKNKQKLMSRKTVWKAARKSATDMNNAWWKGLGVKFLKDYCTTR